MVLFETDGLACSRQFAHNAGPIPVSGCRGSTSRKAVKSRRQARSRMAATVAVAVVFGADGPKKADGWTVRSFPCFKPGNPVFPSVPSTADYKPVCRVTEVAGSAGGFVTCR